MDNEPPAMKDSRFRMSSPSTPSPSRLSAAASTLRRRESVAELMLEDGESNLGT